MANTKRSLLYPFASVFAFVWCAIAAMGKMLRAPLILDIFRQQIWARTIRSMGADSRILPGAVIHGRENLSIGRSVTIGEYCHMWANGGLTIGDDSLIAAHCTLTTLSHNADGQKYRETTFNAPIKIGTNVWLGYGVVVMPGVSIGDNAIIGAGAVVTKDVPPNAVAVGVPARVVRQR